MNCEPNKTSNSNLFCTPRREDVSLLNKYLEEFMTEGGKKHKLKVLHSLKGCR